MNQYKETNKIYKYFLINIALFQYVKQALKMFAKVYKPYGYQNLSKSLEFSYNYLNVNTTLVKLIYRTLK